MQDREFEALYEEHARPLFAFLTYRTGNRALAEDLMADTFERALRARRRFNPLRGSRKTWLYAIAMNCLRDDARRDSAKERALQRVGAASDVTDGPDVDFERLEGRLTIMQALDVLSPEERDVIALRFGAELTAPEIARLLDAPLTTVEGRLYRALPKLRPLLDGEA
jgi:RNA polymerase sigma-70 factor (ECF subfamily)